MNWDQYLSPLVPNPLHVPARTFSGLAVAAFALARLAEDHGPARD